MKHKIGSNSSKYIATDKGYFPSESGINLSEDYFIFKELPSGDYPEIEIEHQILPEGEDTFYSSKKKFTGDDLWEHSFNEPPTITDTPIEIVKYFNSYGSIQQTPLIEITNPLQTYEECGRRTYRAWNANHMRVGSNGDVLESGRVIIGFFQKKFDYKFQVFGHKILKTQYLMELSVVFTDICGNFDSHTDGKFVMDTANHSVVVKVCPSVLVRAFKGPYKKVEL